jgi:hypothetical protein
MNVKPLLLVVALSACDLVGPGEREVSAYLGDSGAPVHFAVPDTVPRATLFDVEFAYWGSSTCTTLARVEQIAQGNTRVLIPLIAESSGSCTSDLRRFVATTSVRIESSGTAFVRLLGRFGADDTVLVRNVWVR